MLRRFFLMLVATGTAFLSWTALSWGCAVCLTGANDSSADGFNTSVLFLMSTPYLVVGSIVAALIFSYRRALKRREQVENAEAEEPARS